MNHNSRVYKVMPKTRLSRPYTPTSRIRSSVSRGVVQDRVECARRIYDADRSLRVQLLESGVRASDLGIPV